MFDRPRRMVYIAVDGLVAERRFSIAGCGNLFRRPSLGQPFQQGCFQLRTPVDLKRAPDATSCGFALRRIRQIADRLAVALYLPNNRRDMTPQLFGNFVPRYSGF